jgi:hypothetical protein
MNFHEIGEWVEKHPYWTAGGVFVIGAAIVLIYNSTASSGPQLSVTDQLRLIRAQFAGQRGLITAQNEPALASARSQTQQASIAARSQTDQARIAANSQNYATKLNSQDILTGYKYQQQESNYQTEIQAFIAEIMGYNQVQQSEGGTPWITPIPTPGGSFPLGPGPSWH